MHKIVNGGKIIYSGPDARAAMVAWLKSGGEWRCGNRVLKRG
jgi:hypothetical protein